MILHLWAKSGREAVAAVSTPRDVSKTLSESVSSHVNNDNDQRVYRTYSINGMQSYEPGNLCLAERELWRLCLCFFTYLVHAR
jgi:hypothetical protein